MNQNFFANQPSSVSSDRVLYTPSAFARTSLLYLQETGNLRATKAHTSAREGLSSFLFFTVTSGCGVLVYEGEKYELTEGNCVFIDCEKAYSHSTGENLWSLKWCHFNGPEMKGIYDNISPEVESQRFPLHWTILLYSIHSFQYLPLMSM